MASAIIGALRVVLSADTAEFKRALTEAEKIAERAGKAIGTGLRYGLTALAGAAAAGAVALTALTKSSMETISNQVDLARRVGASVAAIQTLQHATELSGGSAEALAKALGTLNAKLGEAAQKGAGPAYDAIKQLGLSIKDLSNMDADERIKAISDRMVELGLSSQSQSAILKALGVKQQELTNLFIEGSSAINASREELQAWGVLLSDVDASKVEAAGDAWDKIKTVLQGVGNQLAVKLSPFIQAAADYLTTAAKEAGGFGSVIDKAITMAVHGFAAFQKDIYDTSIGLDKLIGQILDLFDAIAGAPPNLLAKIFGGTAEDYGFEKVNKSFGHLKDTLEKPLSAEQWDKILDGIREKADKAAEAASKIKPALMGDDDTNKSEADIKAEQKERERIQARLESLQESLMTESETARNEYEKRLADLEEFHKAQMLSEQEYADLKLRINQDYADQLKGIQDDIAKDNMRKMQQQMDGWFGVANQIGNALDTIFGESKAVALAQAIINTAQAVTRSLAEYGATPLGLAAAAAAAAAGAAQIATITRTTKTSKGGGAGVNFATSQANASNKANQSQSATAGNNQTLYINGLTTGSLFSSESVRELAGKLIDFQRDGGKVVLGHA